MLEMKFVSQQLELVQHALAARGAQVDLEAFKDAEAGRKSILREVEALRHRRNVVSDEIADRKKSGENADQLVAEMRGVGARIRQLDALLSECEETIKKLLLEIPNMPHESVPFGKDSSANPVVRQVGRRPEFAGEPKPHWELEKTSRYSTLTGLRK